ncbi:hypothetical protein pb186bvf_008092 [Paramecium bursaria]
MVRKKLKYNSLNIYKELQENETLIEEYQDPDEFKKQVEVQEKEFKKAVQELNELNQKEKQNKILLDQLKKLPKQPAKKKGNYLDININRVNK